MTDTIAPVDSTWRVEYPPVIHIPAGPPCLIAVDPGANGGIAIRGAAGTEAHPMPDSETAILELFRQVLRKYPVNVSAVIERVGGYAGSGQPGSAMFKFGRSTGVIVGILMTLGIPFREVTPQSWQKRVGAGNSKDHDSKPAWKRHLRDMAQKRHPHLKVTLNTADALLMLEA